MRDVIVIGGGPAGSSCARELRRAGLDVLVIDRARFPRNKVCAGWVTPPVFEALELSPSAYAGEFVLQPIHGFRVGRIGEAMLDITYGETVSFGVRRCEFDTHLLRRSGARVTEGVRVKSISRAQGVWTVGGDDGQQYRAPVLIGAGGHFDPLARELSDDEARRREAETVVVAKEIEFRLPLERRECSPIDPRIPELYFERDLLGYGWVVQKGGWINVGIGRQDRSGLAARARAFLDQLVGLGRVPPDMPRALEGHAYLLHEAAPRPVGAPGALLVGDAAGMAYGVSGEGIRPAVESGIMAARSVIASGVRVDEGTVARYELALRRRFGPRHGGPTPRLVDRVPPFVRDPLVRSLMTSRWFAEHFMVNRWFLQRHVGPLSAGNAARESVLA